MPKGLPTQAQARRIALQLQEYAKNAPDGSMDEMLAARVLFAYADNELVKAKPAK